MRRVRRIVPRRCKARVDLSKKWWGLLLRTLQRRMEQAAWCGMTAFDSEQLAAAIRPCTDSTCTIHGHESDPNAHKTTCARQILRAYDRPGAIALLDQFVEPIDFGDERLTIPLSSVMVPCNGVESRYRERRRRLDRERHRFGWAVIGRVP